MSRRYKCTSSCCQGNGRTFLGHDHRVMEDLHPLIAASFPAILTPRGGITSELLDRLLDSAAKFKGCADVAQRMRREQALQHSKGESAWLEAREALADVPQIMVCARQLPIALRTLGRLGGVADGG